MLLKIVVIGGLCWAGNVHAENKRAVPPERVSVYKVALVCPAAPQIGCGSRAKPILLALESEPGVAEAWLNRPGTLMAIIWKQESKRKERVAAFKAIREKEDFSAVELSGGERKKALSDFLSGEGWLRGSDVDRLSTEEAGIMARRLIRKIRGVVILTDEKAMHLQSEITETIQHGLTGKLPAGTSTREEIAKVLRHELSEKEANLLQDALKDYRPNRDEP